MTTSKYDDNDPSFSFFLLSLSYPSRLQWGSLGAVNHITIDNNYHNQTVDGGCANPQYADTCQSTGFCPAHYPPSTCGGVDILNNVQVNGSAWPPAALAIEATAGPPK